MGLKWFFIAIVCIAFSVSLMFASNTYNATKAGLEECPQKGAGKGHAKVIKMVKSEKTGAYTFEEGIVPNEVVQEYFKK